MRAARGGSDEAEALRELNESIKAQQAFLNSCGDATWISEEERRVVRWLLSALIDHRRRVRITTRLWCALNPNEPVPSALVAETVELIDENRRFVPYIAQWRATVVSRTRVERAELWRSMLELAESNLNQVGDVEQTLAASRR
ncbi:hypothetical protein BH11ACT6_BH11ACT6_48830 [soil metagenome]